MNDYFYKPKENSLPKLNLTTLTTHYISFYTNSSKNKSTSSHYNTHRIPTTNTNISLFSSRVNSNEKGKIVHPKTAKNLLDNKMKKNKKKHIKSNIIYMTEIDPNQTDDGYFALSEIKKIDSTISKRINKNIIWKEKPENKYDIFSSKNRMDIKNIKTRVRQNLSGISINLRKEVNKKNYFPSENIETIQEANKIIKRIKNNMIQDENVTKKYNHFNRIDLHTFREHNRDICLKNILINIVKSESNKLKQNEKIVNQALKEAHNDFIKDTETFEKLTRTEITNFRMKEIQLDEAIRQNRVYIDEIKKRNSELHGTRDEVKKYVKDIILYIKYENFIKKIMSKEKNDLSIQNEKELSKLDYLRNDKDLDIVIKSIIKEYYRDNHEYKLILIEEITPEMINNLFAAMESNIINALETRDLIIKEIDEDKKRYETILNDLKLKIEQNKNELNILSKEKNLYNLTSPSNDIKGVIDENQNYVMMLYEELSKYVKDKKLLKAENFCFNTFYLLHILQDKLFNVLNELNEITENNENIKTLKSITEKLKLENKREKQNSKKSLAKKLIEEKHKKLQQRMLRFKVRGPITFPPPWALNKTKKMKKIKRDEKAENDEILFY